MIISAGLLLLGMTGQAATDCDGARSTAEAAAEAGDLAAMKASYAAIAACVPEYGDWLGRKIAMAEYNAATSSAAVDEARLVASLAYGRPWQTLAMLGDLAADRKDRALASQRFQEALVEIDDPKRTPKPPAAQLIESIRKKAEVASLLSPDHVPMARARDGSTSGLGAVSLRGVKVTNTALPVWFDFGTANLNAHGQKAADDAAEMIKVVAPGTIVTLVGHTDQVGDAAVNQRLSLARAERVRDYVKSKGVTVSVKVIGRGEEEPYPPDDPAKYSEEEKARMSRRVELKLQ